MNPNFSIRPALRSDVPAIMNFIRELAEFEKLLHEVKNDKTQLEASLFASPPLAYALVAVGESDTPLGFALYFPTYSTFTGYAGIHLEDLYVSPAFRSQGIATALIKSLAGLALQTNCTRLEWAVLEWNEPAKNLYGKMGAQFMTDWQTCRVSGEDLVRLAQPNES